MEEDKNVANQKENPIEKENNNSQPDAPSKKNDSNKKEEPGQNKEIRRDRILFDSMVENERDSLQHILKCQIYGEDPQSSYPCSVFCGWLVKQLKASKIQPLSPTLMYNLEYLETKKNNELFTKEGSSEKKNSYLDKIEKDEVIDYENEEIDLYALAGASREYLLKKAKFFDEKMEKEIKKIYEGGEKTKKDMLKERMPFIMEQRPVFRLIKKVSEPMERKKAIDVWKDVIVPNEITQKEDVLSDLFDAEFDFVPLSFYESN